MSATRAAVALGSAAALLATVARADPPPSITVEPSSLRLGEDHAATVTVTTRGDPPIECVSLQVSTGTVAALERRGPGRFVARYAPPAERAPDVAVFVACDGAAVDRCAAASLPLAGRYHLTLTLEPRARVEVQVGAAPPRQAQAPASGALDLVLHVPPGVAEAAIVATDAVGNRTQTREPLELPPAHRVVLVAPGAPATDAPRPAGEPVRWLVAAAAPDGSLATDAPPSLAVDGATYVLAPLGPGLFSVTATPPRRATESRVVLRASAPDVAAVPAELDARVAGSPPTTIAFARGVEPVRAGGELVAQFAVRAADGGAVVGLEGELRARVDGVDAVRVEPRGDGYAVVARAPERAGSVPVRVALGAAEGRAALEGAAVARVVAGPPVRVLADAPGATVGERSVVTVRGLDRYGNPAPIGHPTVLARGATVLRVGSEAAASGAVAVALRPTAASVRLEVRGDYDLADAVDVPAQVPVVRPFALGIVGTARWNGGALVTGGARARFEGDVRIARWLSLAPMGEVGAEGGLESDAQGRSASLVAVPAQARLGLLAQLGPVGLGPVGGVGARWVLASSREATGAVTTEGAVLPLFSAALVVRVRLPVGVAVLDVGYESGVLDTAAARGTLGGLQGALGWLYAF